jgi:sugar lactone lactonase YvrE
MQKKLIVKKVCMVFIIMFCMYIVPSRFPAIADETYHLGLMWPARSNPWCFYLPEGVATDSSGHVYVADTYKQRIQKYRSNGDFITQWGSQGSGEGQFEGPRGVAVDSAGCVYVADTLKHRIQKSSPSPHHLKATLIEWVTITSIVFSGAGFLFLLKARRIISKVASHEHGEGQNTSLFL